MPRAAVVYNPIAGAGHGAPLAEEAARLLRENGWEVETLATRGPGDAEPLARQVAERVDRLVVAGGDGSVREAVSGLVAAKASRRVELGILPCGNANVVARELGLPLDPRQALPWVVQGTPRPFDLGYANGRLFLAVVGVGWDARTVRRLSRIRASRLGSAWYRLWADSVYLLAGLIAAFFARPTRLQVHVDGKLEGSPAPRRYSAAIVANLRCYGKGWSMTPDAAPDSGRLHFQARKRRGPLFVLWQLLCAMLRRRTPAFVSDHGTGSELIVSSERPFPVQVDGDDQGDVVELRLQVEPAAARFLGPAADPTPR